MGCKLPMKLSGDGAEEWEGEGQPVNTISHSLSISPLSVCINVLFEFEEAITDISHGKKVIMVDYLLSTNPLFSCIMKKDDWGVLRWQKTTVNVDDHTFLAEFPPGQESYDACVDDYISKLALKPLDQSRPLWEFHLMNYKTSKAGATLVIKIHHSLGDGISLMSSVASFARRIDNPDLPPTFPSANRGIRSTTISKHSVASKYFHLVWYFILVAWYTMVDVISSSLRTMGWVDDSHLPVRGPPEVQYMPIALSSATFYLEDIKQIKNSVGGTVNDVATGIIFYGLQRYLQIRLSAVGEKNLQSAVGEKNLQDAYEKRFELLKDSVMKQMKNSRVTALCLLNTRVLAGIQNLEEMLKPESQAPWGNHFAFMHVRVPLMDKVEDPLEFVRSAKRIIDRHKMSLAAVFNTGILRCLARFKGAHAITRSLYNTIANTSVMISNMIGPMEQVAIGGNPLKSFSFFVSGAPISLYVSILSYMDTINIQVIGPKSLIDVNMLCKCFTEAFEEIKEASIHGKSS